MSDLLLANLITIGIVGIGIYIYHMYIEYKKALYYENLRSNVANVIEKSIMFTVKYYPLLSSNIHLESIKNMLGDICDKTISNNHPVTLPPNLFNLNSINTLSSLKQPSVCKQKSYKSKPYSSTEDEACAKQLFGNYSPIKVPKGYLHDCHCSNKTKTECDKSDDDCDGCDTYSGEGFEIKI